MLKPNHRKCLAHFTPRYSACSCFPYTVCFAGLCNDDYIGLSQLLIFFHAIFSPTKSKSFSLIKILNFAKFQEIVGTYRPWYTDWTTVIQCLAHLSIVEDAVQELNLHIYTADRTVEELPHTQKQALKLDKSISHQCYCIVESFC